MVENNVLFVRRERLSSIISFFLNKRKLAEQSLVQDMASLCLDTFTREVQRKKLFCLFVVFLL